MASPEDKLKGALKSAMPNVDSSALESAARKIIEIAPENFKADQLYPNMDKSKADEFVKTITRGVGYGDFSTAIMQAYQGHNHRGMGNSIPINTDQYGMTFFTRPRMNLSYDNIIADRTFVPMMTTNEYSVARAVRAWLDPVGSYKARSYAGKDSKGSVVYQNDNSTRYSCPLIDDLNPFITILDNSLISLNGWPDPFVDTYTSKAGVYKEELSFVDGFAKIYNSFDLTANFRNMVGDPISYLFNVWTQYAAFVHEGVMNPWPEMIIENEIDYNTRIYRLVLDRNREYVQKIAATGAAFPTSNTLGASFNYNSDKPLNPDIDQISVTFRCMGAIYLDPILVQEFNQTVQLFNINMADGLRQQYYKRLSTAEKPLFNYHGYPRINPETMRLEWWVSNADYDAIMKPQQTLVGKVGGDIEDWKKK